MKKILFILTIAIIGVACEKEETTINQPEPITRDVDTNCYVINHVQLQSLYCNYQTSLEAIRVVYHEKMQALEETYIPLLEDTTNNYANYWSYHAEKEMIIDESHTALFNERDSYLLEKCSICPCE